VSAFAGDFLEADVTAGLDDPREAHLSTFMLSAQPLMSNVNSKPIPFGPGGKIAIQPDDVDFDPIGEKYSYMRATSSCLKQ
jgi:hypothetical protein